MQKWYWPLRKALDAERDPFSSANSIDINQDWLRAGLFIVVDDPVTCLGIEMREAVFFDLP